MAQVLTTEGVDPRDRLAYWREVICDTFIKLEVAPATPSRFRGMVKIDNAGPVQITRLRADPMVARRTRNHLRQLDEEMCLLVVQLRGRTLAGQDGRTASLARGDVALFDSVRPYTVDFRGDDFDHLVLQFPRQLFTQRAVVPEDVTARAIAGTSAVGQLLFPFAVSVARAAESAAPETSARLGEMLLDLLAGALSGEARPRDEPRDGNDFELLQRIQLYAHAHLSDPTLSPGKAAAATHTSLRQLHRVFAAQGTSFSRWVRTERLRRCYEDLSAAGQTGISISAVGRRWGFNDLPTMSKAFRSQYGLSPREYRRSAR